MTLSIYAIPHPYSLHNLVIFFPCQFILLLLLDSFQLCDSEEIKHQTSSSYISSAWQCNLFCLKAVSSTEIIACLLLTGATLHRRLNSCLHKTCTSPVYSQWSYSESKPAVPFTAKAVTVVGQNPSSHAKVQRSSSPTATCIPTNKKWESKHLCTLTLLGLEAV